ncbi:acyl-oxidase [Ceraceosorus bombacis]|uniref:Acyl-coenzyme A oxidase n=1 Tax=Ceraceosorus bombacis TaxID=401625 RepID=A0A0P1B8H5_9BASI|nr:acyl-oxidase [Ceraceosorus bombacis]
MASSWRDSLPLETMAKERQNPPFNVRAMSIAQHGTEKELLLKEKFMLEISRDPIFYMGDVHDLTKDQLRERTMAKIGSLVHCVQNESIEHFTKRMELIGLFDPGFWTRFGVHYGLFLGAIRSGATANQFSYWMEKGVVSCKGMYGCFGMTELAHGSNVAGLETTATFDEQTDEFVVHTPNIGATKWWIGGAAQTATHCSVFAQMIIRGKKHGVKTFIVPLREPQSFQLLPGINIGDIGKKMGRDGIDNGYIQFTNVRIPRAYMLMKHTQVTREGQVFEPPMQQLSYVALLQGRVSMVVDTANTAKKALTIAVRYAAVRRQFKSSAEQEHETPILDYLLHQRRLMPLVAQATAFAFTALNLTKMFEETSASLEAMEPGPEMDRALEQLKSTHISSSGLKAHCVWQTLEAIKQARLACGGHGYSSYNGFASMEADFAVHATWEGDNHILALQSGRSLVQSYLEALEGKKSGDATDYLNDLDNVLKRKCKGGDALLDLKHIEEGWGTVTAHAVKKAGEDYQSHIKAGKSKELAFEEASQSRFVAAMVHVSGFIFRQFKQAVERMEDKGDGVKEHLTRLAVFYGLWRMEEQGSFFLRSGWLSPADFDAVQAKVTDFCADTRKYVIPLVDSWSISDHVLNSPIGRWDGDIYRAYFGRVRQQNPQLKAHPYFEKLIKPFLFRPDIELEDYDEAIGIDDEITEIQEEREEAAAEAKEAAEAAKNEK